MLYTSYKLCPARQNGTNASNVKNIFFIIVGFYRLPPDDLTLPPTLPLLLPTEPELKLPVLLEELLLDLTVELLLLEEELLGLTYSELERTWRLLLAGVYDLRSEDADDDGLVDDVLAGRDAEDGLTALEGRVLLLAGRALLDGLSLTLEAGANPADAGLWVLPATCKPPCPLGRGFGAGARPPPGCGLLG